MAASGSRDAVVVLGMAMLHRDAEDFLSDHVGEVRRHVGPQRELAATLRGADGLVARAPMRVGAAEIAAGAPRLRVITGSGAGYDCVDVTAATAAGIPVLNVPDVGANTVADFVIGALIAVARGLVRLNGIARGSELDWGQRFGDYLGLDLRGRTLGLLGLGNIGRRVAQGVQQALGMNVVAVDRGRPAPTGVRLLSGVDAVVEAADALCVCLPLTNETVGLLDAARLNRMRPGSILVNVARGGIVDESALAKALANGQLAGAAVDVFADEPAIGRSPLVDAPNCLLSPHVAGLTRATARNLAMTAAMNLVRALDGDWPGLPVVNPEVLSG